MNADGSGQTRLTNNAAFDWTPEWSPDGSKIAFASDRDGNQEIYVMNADGSGQTNRSNNPSYDEFPAWSPDGSKIAFVSGRDGNHEIYVMNADGSGQTNRSNNPSYDELPAWSPDGSKIAFESTRDGNYEIYVMDTDGSGQARLTNNAAFDGVPAWSPGAAKPPPPAFRLPFEETEDWVLTCGPHPWTPCGTSGTTNALDFAPPGNPYNVCATNNSYYDSNHWVRPAARGTVVSVDPDSLNRTFAQTNYVEIAHDNGYRSVYYHVKEDPDPTNTDQTRPAITPGLKVELSTKLGHPSCLTGAGGSATGVHLHFGLKLGTQWTSVVGATFSGWTVQAGVGLNGKLKLGTACTVFVGQAVNCPGHKAPVVQHGALLPSQSLSLSVNIPPGQIIQGAFVGWAGSTVDSSLETPGGTIIDATTIDPNVDHTKGENFEYYQVTNPQAGDWVVHLYGTDLPAEGEDVSVVVSFCPAAAGDAAGNPCSGDDDGDGCTDAQELGASETSGGRRDPLNPWDYMNPSHDGTNRIDDVLAVVQAYFDDAYLDPPTNSIPNPAYNRDTDRTPLGPNLWNLGPPDGLQRLDDILAIIAQYYHDCS